MILSFCENPTVLEVMRIVRIGIRIITIIVPIILIVSSMIMFVREMTGGKDDLVSNGLKGLATKMVAAVLIFLIPTFVNIIAELTADNTEFSKCLNFSTAEGINQGKQSTVVNLISTARSTLNEGDYQRALSEVNKINNEKLRNEYLNQLSLIKSQIDIKQKVEDYINEGTVESYTNAINMVSKITNVSVRNDLILKLRDLKSALESNNGGGSNSGSNSGSSGGGNSSGGGSANINIPGSSNKLEMFFIGSSYYDDAILIRTDSNVIMIDGGRYNASKSVTPYLQKLGISKIDLLLGSHLHFNHIQAQADILNNFSVSNITYPDDIFTCANRGSCDTTDQKYILDAIKNKNMTPKITKPGDIITVGDMKLYFMEPVSINTTSKYPQNANSSVFILKYKNNSFMFTGDISLGSSQINHIKEYANNFGISTDVDVLKYPHHGNTTVSDNLLDTIKPEYVIVPNRGTPSKPINENMNRLNNHGVKVFKQSDSTTGNIYLQSDGTNISVYTNY